MSQFKQVEFSACWGNGDETARGEGIGGIEGWDVVVCVFKFLVVSIMDCWSIFSSAPSAGSTSIEVKIPTKPQLG